MPVDRWRLVVATIWTLQVLTPSAVSSVDALCQYGDSCCAAQKAFHDAEADGGCNTKKMRNKNSNKCDEAESLCEECEQKNAVRRNTFPGSSSNGTLGLNLTQEGILLAAFTGDDLEMRCVSPKPPEHCGLGDLGILIVFLAGLMLLIVILSGAMLFDSYCLPFMVLRFSRSWLAPWSDLEAPKSPLMSSEQRPEMFTPHLEGPQSLRDLASTASPPVQAAFNPQAPPYPKRKSAPPPLGPAIDLPASPRIVENTCSGNPVDAPSGKSGDMIAPGIALGHPVMVTPSSTKAVLEHSIGGEWRRPSTSSMQSTASTEGGWPARLARMWAFRVAFLVVASIAVFARLALITLSAIITFDRSALVVSLELVACLVPYAWCALTSRPPPDSSYGVPHSIGYVCGRFPRFSIFVILTLALEIYCAVVAASAVASTSCDDPSWRSVILYAGDIPVLVSRIYSALLAIRLQDRLSHAARRVLPDFKSAKAPAKARDIRNGDASMNFTDLTNIEPEEEPDVSLVESTHWRSPVAVVGRVDVAKQIEHLTDVEDDMKAFQNHRRTSSKQTHSDDGARGSFSSWLCWSFSRSPADKLRPPSPTGSPSSHPSSQSRLVSRLRQRLHIRSNAAIALSAGLLLALVAGSVAIWASHLVHMVDEPDPLPSSCSTAQNATATCAQFESVGAWDPSARDFASAAADTMQDCCRGCDGQKDCQAWMFESVAKSCRWIRFLEDPCTENPGDLRCRCVTHFGTAFGFKPTSQVVWVKREGVQ